MIQGASPVSLNGKRVATLFFRSTARSKFQLSAQLQLEDGTVFATFERAQAPGLVQWGWPSDIEVAVRPQETQYGSITG